MLTIKIPRWLDKPSIFFLLTYRRLRYGYAFRKIPLSKGKFALVDPEDYERLNKYKWHASGPGEKLYAKRAEKHKCIYMHREIISVGQGMVADHINHNRLDNRKANLRPATMAQNLYNWAHAGHRFKGVSWSTQRRKWRVQVSFNGRRINVGFFADKIQAAKAYDAAVKKYHGEFAVLNLSD